MLDDIRTTAARVLGDAWDSPVGLSPDVSVLDGMPKDDYPTVVRLYVRSPSDAPATVVVKRPGNWAAYDPGSLEGTAPGFFNDWASLEFFGRLDPSIAPRFYGGDRDSALLVMEDLGSEPTLADLLLGPDPDAARRGLADFGAVLGRMHAASVGRAEEFAELRTNLGPVRATVEPFDVDRECKRFRAACDALRLTLPSDAMAEAEAAIAALLSPDDLLVYTHGDPCPDNVYVGDRPRVIDFEMGGFRHALRDGSYARVPFPTCWCVNRVPEDGAAAAEAAYAEALRPFVPLPDERFDREMTHVCAAWLVGITGWEQTRDEILGEDASWGIATRHQRLLMRWELFSSYARPHLPSLSEFAVQLAERFRELWPELDAMPVYPAFRV